MPQGTQEDHPPINIADVLPRSHMNPRDKREMFLDLERYRKCLTASFQKLALFRVLDMPRPGPKVYEWQNYWNLLAPVYSPPSCPIWDWYQRFKTIHFIQSHPHSPTHLITYEVPKYPTPYFVRTPRWQLQITVAGAWFFIRNVCILQLSCPEVAGFY